MPQREYHSDMFLSMPPLWEKILESELNKDYWQDLSVFLKCEYLQKECFPHFSDIFRAFEMTPFDQVKVVILGQDPYHTPGAAMGMSFSIPSLYKTQPSLKNIFKELSSDLGIDRTNTDLSDWANQ
jgi:uracil-DNA glycosylase